MARSLPQPPDGSPTRVVVVDDQATFRQAARLLLTARGYHVVAEAACAATAWGAVERHGPAGVLLDVRLGSDDGFVVCELLTRSRPELAVLLVSADEPMDPARIARCGARGFVQKHRLLQIDFAEFWAPELTVDGPRNGSAPRRATTRGEAPPPRARLFAMNGHRQTPKRGAPSRA
jgi:CheY-like chemotaxis protein